MNAFETGVTLQGIYPPDEFASMVQLIDGLGYDYLWMTDSSLHTRNPYVYLSHAARMSGRLKLGTAVTNPRSRHPGIVAVNAATLEEFAPGRTILGIGAGDRPLRALDLRPARLAELESSVESIRELLRGEHVTTEGPGFAMRGAHLRFRSNLDIPVYFSASGPKTLRLAGAVADGVILLCGLFEAGIRYALERIDEGARAAGRPRPHIAVFGYGAISEDEDVALAAARPIAAWFAQTVPRYCELAGLDPAVADEVRARYAGGEFQEAHEAAGLLPDDYIRKMAFAGNQAHAVSHIAALVDAGVDSINVFPLGSIREQTIDAFTGAVEAYRRS